MPEAVPDDEAVHSLSYASPHSTTPGGAVAPDASGCRPAEVGAERGADRVARADRHRGGVGPAHRGPERDPREVLVEHEPARAAQAREVELAVERAAPARERRRGDAAARDPASPGRATQRTPAGASSRPRRLVSPSRGELDRVIDDVVGVFLRRAEQLRRVPGAVAGERVPGAVGQHDGIEREHGGIAQPQDAELALRGERRR